MDKRPLLLPNEPPKKTPITEKLSFLRGGYYYYYYNGNLRNRGSDGFYWESEISNVTYARNLHFGSPYLLPQHYGNKGLGFSVRCVAR